MELVPNTVTRLLRLASIVTRVRGQFRVHHGLLSKEMILLCGQPPRVTKALRRLVHGRKFSLALPPSEFGFAAYESL
jgi:hypothetical protein